MKTNNLVKVLLLLMSLVAISVAIVGCGDDDDKPDTPEMKADIVGKWKWEKTIDNEGVKPHNSERCKNKIDYTEFAKNGTYTECNYNEECEILYKATGKWKISDKMLTLTGTTIVAYDKEDIGVDFKGIFKVLEANNNSLVIKAEQAFRNGREIQHDSSVTYFSRMKK